MRNKISPSFLICRQILPILCFSLLWRGSLDAIPVEEYVQATGIARLKNTKDSPTSEFVVVRQFRSGEAVLYLLVDPASLKTYIRPAASLDIDTFSMEKLKKKFATSPYFEAIARAEANDLSILDAGITHIQTRRKGIHLTIDLCPSVRPLDRIFFIQLISALQQQGHTIPVAISITGVWMKKHPSDLQWLQTLERLDRLKITWVNHSYNHFVQKNKPLIENFLLSSGTNIRDEVFLTEIALIENGIVPSIFFRFPGLVSDPEIFKEITRFGLIPIGSDAWLGKNQWPHPGSIVLVHANGNESIGLYRFLKLLREEQGEIKHHRWQLFDLRESIEETEGKDESE